MGIPAFQALVKSSEGYVLSHDSFAAPPMAHNLAYVVSQTHISIADCVEASSDGAEGISPLPENHLEGCIVDVRISRCVLRHDRLLRSFEILSHLTADSSPIVL